jgi:hypothetical protein
MQNIYFTNAWKYIIIYCAEDEPLARCGRRKSMAIFSGYIMAMVLL